MQESNTQTNNPPSFVGAVEINNRATFPVDCTRIQHAVKTILSAAQMIQGSISVAIVNDATIRKLNRQYLNHDYETDVLSFALEADQQRQWIEGEIIVSFETALRRCVDFQWPADDELLLYIVHGAIHLTGQGDKTSEDRKTMRKLEQKYLGELGVEFPQAVDRNHSSEEAES